MENMEQNPKKQSQEPEKKKGLCGKCPFNIGFPMCICCIGIIAVAVYFILIRK